MARLFNGSSDFANTASTLNLTAYTKLAVVLWLWWDAFANTGHGTCFGESQSFPYAKPNNADGTFLFGNVNQDFADRIFARPSAGDWHQYVFNYDIAQTGTAEAVSAYVDGTLQSLTNNDTGDNTGNYLNHTWYLMVEASGSSNWAAGRIAEFAIYGGITLNQTDATNLQTQTPDQVQAGSLLYYWKLCGTASPEPATTGGIDMTLTGTSQTSHPTAMLSSCGGAAPLPPVPASRMVGVIYSQG